MQQSPSQLTRRFEGNLPVRARHALTLVPPVAQAAAPEAVVESNGIFLATFRANLQASVRHAALGHAGTSFRECTGAACREAAIMIPELESLAMAATDDELDVILGDVLTSLEKEGTPYSAPQPS
ncbi:MAG TPA: hypothetical protein VNW71_22370 [Thermoanaerobaculia bacterium]|nr:hypothetical protein [Thermoanaerobaculia bacterium]